MQIFNITLHDVSDFMKPWSPIIGAVSFIFMVYRSVQKKIGTWANSLLNNHMAHLQKSLENIDAAQKHQVDHLAVQSDNLQAQTILLQQIANDLRPTTIIVPRKRGKYASAKMKN
jgi:hypothetical protein